MSQVLPVGQFKLFNNQEEKYAVAQSNEDNAEAIVQKNEVDELGINEKSFNNEESINIDTQGYSSKLMNQRRENEKGKEIDLKALKSGEGICVSGYQLTLNNLKIINQKVKNYQKEELKELDKKKDTKNQKQEEKEPDAILVPDTIYQLKKHTEINRNCYKLMDTLALERIKKELERGNSEEIDLNLIEELNEPFEQLKFKDFEITKNDDFIRIIQIDHFNLGDKIFEITTVVRRRPIKLTKIQFNGYVNLIQIQIRNHSKYKDKPIIINQTINAQEYPYPQNYVKFWGGLLIYVRDQEDMDKVDQQDDQKQYFDKSVQKLFWFSFFSMQLTELQEFSIQEGTNRQDLFFVREIFQGQNYLILWLEDKDDQKLLSRKFQDLNEMKSEAKSMRDKGTYLIGLVDIEQKKLIEDEIEAAEQVVILALEHEYITCRHFRGKEKECGVDCVAKFVRNLFAISQKPPDLYPEMYNFSEQDRNTKNKLISLKDPNYSFVEEFENENVGACVRRTIEKNDSGYSQLEYEIEIHEGRKRKRYKIQLSKDKQEEIDRDRILKQLKDKTYGNNPYQRHIQPLHWKDCYLYYFDNEREVNFIFTDDSFSKQKEGEIAKEIQEHYGKSDQQNTDCKLLVKQEVLKKQNEQYSIEQEYFLRDQADFRDKFQTHGYYLASIFVNKDEIIFKTIVESKLKMFKIKEYYKKILDQEQRDQEFGQNLTMNFFLKAQINRLWIRYINQKNKNIALSGDCSQVIEIDRTNQEIRELDSKHEIYNENGRKMILIENKHGEYMPVYFSGEFEFCDYKTDWSQYIFAFRSIENGQSCFVSKSIYELQNLQEQLLIEEIKQNDKDDQESEQKFQMLKLNKDDGKLQFTKYCKEAYSGYLSTQEYLGQCQQGFLVCSVGGQYICVVDLQLKNIASQKMLYKSYQVNQISETLIENNQEKAKFNTQYENYMQDYEIIRDQINGSLEIQLASLIYNRNRYQFTSYYSKENKIKGLVKIDGSFIIENDMKLKYCTKLLEFGLIRYGDLQNNNYILKTRQTKEFQDSKEFTQQEKVQIMKNNFETQMRQIPFQILKCLQYDYHLLFIKGPRTLELLPQEIFYGMSIFDHHLQNGLEFIKFLRKKQKEQQEFKLINKPIIWDRNQEEKAYFDYQMETVLSKAIKLGCPATTIGSIVKIIQDQSDKNQSRNILMADIHNIFKMKEISIEIQSILGGGHTKIDETNEVLVIQEPIMKVAEVANVDSNVIVINEIPIGDSGQQVAMEKLQQWHTKMKEKSKEDLQIEVQHVLVDFSYLQLRNKLDAIEQDKQNQLSLKHYNLVGNFYLSDLISGIQKFEHVFLTQTIMEIIEMQNKECLLFFEILFFFYLLTFVLPFLYYNMLSDPSEKGPQLMGVCLFSQVVFAILKIPQILHLRLKLFSENIWNVQGIANFLVFIVYFVKQKQNGYQNLKENYLMVLLGQLVLFFNFLRILFYLRINQKFSGLVQMLLTTIKELQNFLIFMTISILYFTFSFLIFNASFDDKDYPGVNPFLIILIQTFRNSIGDIDVPVYEAWFPELPDISDYFLISLIWTFWFLNIVFNLIVLLNFLIAVTSQVYDQVIAQQQYCSFSFMAAFNREYFMIKQYFMPGKKNFVAIVLTQPLDKTHDIPEDVNLGIVNNIKRTLDKQNKAVQDGIAQLKNDQKDIRKTFEQKIDESKKEIKQLNEKIDLVRNDLRNDIKEIMEFLKEQKPSKGLFG